MGIHSKVKSSYLALGRGLDDNRLTEVKWFLEQELDSWKNWIEVPPAKRLVLWRHGFTSPFAKLYDFDSHSPADFMSEIERYRMYKAMNGDHRYLLDDKLSQHWMMSAFPDHRPDAFGLVDDGHVHSVATTNLDEGPVPVGEWLPEALRTHSKLVLKQIRGNGGSEVLVCEYDNETGFSMDGEPVSERALCDRVSELSGYLVSEYVEQHDYAADLYPESPNTIRMLTIWDRETNEIIVPSAIHRIGTDQSRPVDNFSIGGLSAEIDQETGELGPATRKPTSGDPTWYATHPDTGAQIEGATIPQWDEVYSTVTRLARENTNIPALGWDVLVNESGDPVVLEGNTGTDLDVMQVHRPLLTDPRVERVVSRYV